MESKVEEAISPASLEKDIYLIVACTPSGVIGNKGSIPWKSKADMAHFRNSTTYNANGKTNCLLMGSKTFKGMGSKNLPKRKTLRLSKKEPESDVCFSSLDSAIKHWREKEEGDLWICGGAAIYDECISRGLASKLLVTWVIAKEGDDFEGDAKIDVQPLSKETIYKRERCLTLSEQQDQDKAALRLDFVTYIKKEA